MTSFHFSPIESESPVSLPPTFSLTLWQVLDTFFCLLTFSSSLNHLIYLIIKFFLKQVTQGKHNPRDQEDNWKGLYKCFICKSLALPPGPHDLLTMHTSKSQAVNLEQSSITTGRDLILPKDKFIVRISIPLSSPVMIQWPLTQKLVDIVGIQTSPFLKLRTIIYISVYLSDVFIQSQVVPIL